MNGDSVWSFMCASAANSLDFVTKHLGTVEQINTHQLTLEPCKTINSENLYLCIFMKSSVHVCLTSDFVS